MKAGRLIDGVDAVPETRSDSFQIGIADRLDGRCTGKQLLLIFNEIH